MMSFGYAECKSNNHGPIFYCTNKTMLVSFFVHRRKSRDSVRIHNKVLENENFRVDMKLTDGNCLSGRLSLSLSRCTRGDSLTI